MQAAVIDCQQVTKSFGGVKAVSAVSASFSGGRITALVGPNGAGKTTLFHLISGSVQPDQGQIAYMGKPINGLPGWRIAQLGIGRLFQDVRVFGSLTCLENVLVAFQAQLGENPFWSILSRRRVMKQDRQAVGEAAALLESVGLGGLDSTEADSLSYGQQKLLAIARLMAVGSEVYLLDEPTSGVNPEMVKVLIGLIKGLASQGKTVAVIEHNMNVVTELADWVYFLDEGEIVAFGLPDEVLGDKEVRAAYLGF